MTRSVKIAALLGGAVALIGVAALWLLPEPEHEAGKLAQALGQAVGQPARVAGPVAYDYGWPGTLRVARIELGEIGWLDAVSASGDAIAGRAELFGKAGNFAGDAQRFVFAADGLEIERARSGDAWSARFALADRAVTVVGNGPEIVVQWGDLAASGRLIGPAPMPTFELVRTNASPLALSGSYDPSANILEGRLRGPLAGLGEVAASLRIDASLLDIAQFELSGGPLAASGALQQEAGRTSLDLRIADTDLAGLGALAAALPAGDLDLRMRVARLGWAGGEAEGLVLAAARAGDTLAIDELAIRALGGAQLRVRDGQLDLQAADATRFLRTLGVGVERHLGALSVRGRLAVDPQKLDIALAPLELSLAGQRATGALAWRNGRLAAQLNGDRIDLGPFFAKAPAPPPERGPLLTRSQTARAAAAAQPPPPGPGGWARIPLQFDLAGNTALDLTLTARTLVFDAFSLADAQLAATFAGDGIAVQRLIGGFWGGRLDAALRVTGGSRPQVAIDFALSDAELARLAALFGNAQALRGPLSLAGRVATSGRDGAEMAGNLAGQVRLAAPTGSIEGVEFAGLADRLAAGGRPPDLLELGRLLARGGRSEFRNLAGTWTLAKGVATTSDTRLALPGVAGRGGAGRDLGGDLSGNFDIGNWRLDLAFGLSSPVAGPRAVVGLAGPADRPRINLLLQAPGQAPGQGQAPGRAAAPTPAR